MEKTLNGNYTRMLRAVLNKSRKQYPTKQQLYVQQPPTTIKTIQIRRIRVQDIAGDVKTNSLAMYSCRLLHTDDQGLDDQREPIYNSSVLIQVVAWKTCRERWPIERSCERASGKIRASDTT